MSKCLLIAVILFCASVAEAQITFVNWSNSSNVGVTSRSPSEPTGSQENDILLLLCDTDQTDGTLSMSAPWTEIHEVADGAGAQGDVALYWMRRGSGAPSTTQCSYSGSAGRMMATIVGYRGVDTTDAFDVTWSTGTHLVGAANAGNTACGGITTNTANAMIVCFQNTEDTNPYGGGNGAASGYTLNVDDGGDFDRIQAVQSKTKATAGSETPGAWTHDDTAGGNLATADVTNFTVALKLASSNDAIYRRRR
jgi:hypothetical protein